MPPLFDRYGEWPEEPLAQPDPNAPVRKQFADETRAMMANPEAAREIAAAKYNDVTRTIVQRTSNSTFDGTSIVVLDPIDALELERAEVFG